MKIGILGGGQLAQMLALAGISLGCRVERVTGYDTDLLGTFTREIPRAGSQIEAARKKARIGMELSGLSLGLASEGSFGPDPFAGMLPLNVELLVFIDDEHDIDVVGVAQGKANFSHLLAADWAAAESFARQSEFPEHHLVVRPQGEEDRRIRKGIATWEALETAFAQALKQSANGRVFLETDVRAHANPTRQENIRLAAADLAKKLCSLCPACGMPGFWLVERVTGLPCEDCGAPKFTAASNARIGSPASAANRDSPTRAAVITAIPEFDCTMQRDRSERLNPLLRIEGD